MGEFKKGGVPVIGLLPINVGKPVVIDYFGNVGSDVILLIGTSAAIEELNSPMPKAIRRFKITGKSVGPSTLTAPGVNVSVVVSLTPEQQFIEDLATAAVPVAKKFGVPPSVVLGVA